MRMLSIAKSEPSTLERAFTTVTSESPWPADLRLGLVHHGRGCQPWRWTARGLGWSTVAQGSAGTAGDNLYSECILKEYLVAMTALYGSLAYNLLHTVNCTVQWSYSVTFDNFYSLSLVQRPKSGSALRNDSFYSLLMIACHTFLLQITLFM